MAGLDFFGASAFRPEPIPAKKEAKPESVLDDRSAVEELQKLSEGVKSLDVGLANKIAKLAQKKQMLELALAPIKTELENLRQLFLQQMLASGSSSFKREEGGTFSRVKRIHYSMINEKDKVKLAMAVGRQDLLSVTAADFNGYCSEVEKLGKQLPSTVKKSETYTLSVRGV